MGKVTALVTGASSGIGLNYAKELVKYGYNLILVSNQPAELKVAAHLIASQYNYTHLDIAGKIIPTDQGTSSANPAEGDAFANCNGTWITTICKDLSHQSAAQELFDICNEKGIEVEVLVNNAGIFIFKDVADCTIGKISTILNLHMYTVTMLCRLFGEKMRERRKGYILNMSSISAHTPFPGISLYTATKSFIRTLSIALRLEMREYGVHVMTVSPGAVATDLYNLPANLQQLGVNIGVIYRPDKLTRKALHKLFYTNIKEFVPGFINRLFKPIFSILPLWFKMWVRKKTARFMHK